MTFKTIRPTTILTIVLALVIAGFVGRGFLHRGEYSAQPGMAQDPPAAFTAGKPNLVAATFYSAWCSSCAVLDPRLREVAPEFDGRAVQFVKFDFSMGPNDGHQRKADALGIGGLYGQNKGATGFMLLIDSRTEEVIDTITMTRSVDGIRDALNAAITSAASPLAEEHPPIAANVG